MLNLNSLFNFYMFLISLSLLMMFMKHLLLVLIMMEYIMILVFLNMYMILEMLEINMYYMIFFLVLVVCEGALGISLIVSMVRSFGNDYVSSLNLVSW